MERVNAPRTKGLARHGLAAGAAICGLLLTGCASSASPAGVSQPQNADGSVAVGDVGPGPFSTFRSAQLDSIQLAQRATRLNCIADNGYPEIATTIPTEDDPTLRNQLDITSDAFFFASAEDAAKRGFGHPTPASPPKVIPHDAAFGAIADTCDEQAWLALGEDARATVLEYQQIHARLVAEPMKAISAAMPGLTTRLTQCLSDQGHPVTAGKGNWAMDFGIKLGNLQRPDEERTAPAGTKGVEIIPGSPTNPYIPTPEESTLASALYECSQTTGARTDLDQIILDAQHKAEADNADAIKNLNPKIQALAEKSETLAKA